MRREIHRLHLAAVVIMVCKQAHMEPSKYQEQNLWLVAGDELVEKEAKTEEKGGSQ
jgi:hypothetical protein